MLVWFVRLTFLPLDYWIRAINSLKESQMLYRSKRENISRSLTIGWTLLVGTIIIKHSLTALLAWPNIKIETPNKEKRNRLFLISSCFARKRSGIIDLVVLGVTLVISLTCLPLFCICMVLVYDFAEPELNQSPASEPCVLSDHID